MKKSHRKDVLIARIIFAVVCVLLILIIVGAVVLIRGRLEDGKNKPKSQSQTVDKDTQETGGATQGTDPAPETEPSQVQERRTVLRTTDDVRLRRGPNTDCEVITVIDAGTMLEMLGEETGWAFVDYQGQTGYVSMDYLEEVTGAE